MRQLVRATRRRGRRTVRWLQRVRGTGGNVRYEFHTTGDSGEFSDFFNVFFAGESEPVAGPVRGRRPTGGATFEESSPGCAWARTAGQRPAARPRPAPRGAGTTGTARRAKAEATADITMDEAYHGTSRLVDVEGKRLEVSIPRGADTGTRLRVDGKGPGGGDLHVVVRQLPDPEFQRRGADLEREMVLTSRALLGADVRVRTPKGHVVLTIPAGTQPGRMFRLTGQGMPRFRADGQGDLYVKARVVLPTELSTAARDAAHRLFELVDQPDPNTRKT